MNMLKRTLAMMLALIMMISAVPFTAFATESTDMPTEAVVDAPASEPTVPETSVPETSVPETSVPETSVPETSVPETSVPETSVPETSVPETSVPEETVAEETVPEVTVAEEVPMVLSLAKTTSSAVKYQYNVVHLDAGRKYFSVENIKDIIDNIDAAGFNQLELYLSDNQGFRFALDDMTITTDYGTYDLTPALGDGYSDGSKYPDYSGKYLTQDEMDTIIAYANSKGIDIVPCINVPGHMGAILENFTSFRYTKNGSTSKSSISLDNAEAVAFALALTEKYVKYFASQGCNYYSIGADEYANDLSSMGFEGMGQELYNKFVDFMNDAADIIIDAGMIPRAFNDGFYYKNYTATQIDPAYEVCYWSSGWGGYNVATAATIASYGHKLINTHGDYYWVLGNSSWQCSASKASQFDATAFQSGTISDPAGSMFCIWCDNGAADTCENVISKTASVISAFGGALPEVEDLVSGIVTPEPEEPETVTKTDEATKVEITAPGLETVEVKENPAVVTEEKVSKTYSITLNGGAYTDEATVKIPYDTAFDGCNVFIGKVGEDTFPVTKDGDFFICEVPHFSDVEIEGRAVVDDQIIDGTTTSTVTSWALADSISTGGEYIIVNTDSNGTGYALTNNNSTTAGSTEVTIANGAITHVNDVAISDDNVTNILWTFSGTNSGTVKNGTRYVYLNYSGRSATLQLSTSSRILAFTNRGDGEYRIYYNTTTDPYLRYSNGWSATTTGDTRNIYLYKKTTSTETVGAYTINAALQESRIASLTVENESYTDETWNAYQAALATAQAKLTEVKGATYNSESAANTALTALIAAVNALEEAKNNLIKGTPITLKYISADGTVVLEQTKIVPADATSVTLDSSITGTDNEYYTVDNTTLDLVVGTTEYSVAVTLDENAPDDAMTSSTLTVEQWITNTHATTTSGGSSYTFTISRTDASADEGIDITTLAPENAYWSEGMLYYWQSMRLDAANKQTTAGEDDETGDGTPFTHVRYHNGAWQYKDSAGKWNYFLEDDQAVAYYLQKIDVTDEVDTYFKDWGWDFDSQDGDPHVALSVAVVYPDGSLSATEEEIYLNSTVLFNFNNNWGGTGKNRDIGIVAPANNSNYEISKITVTPGERTSGTDSSWETNEGITWEKVTNEAGSEWYKETTYWDKVTDAGTAPVVSGVADNIRWPAANTAYLVLIYLDTVHYDTNLKVQWVDDSAAGALISEMEVAVTYDEGEEPVTYFNALKQTSVVPEVDGPLTLDDNACVTNSSEVDQTFNKDITVMPNVATQYRSGLYQYVGAEIADDGMTLILHYNIDSAKLTPLYVVDFGLPVTFPFSDMVENPDDLSNVTIDSCSYGEATVNMEDETITFTPDEILRNIAVAKITVTYTNNATSTFRMGFVPATTVYYEEDFLLSSDASGWTPTAATIDNQSTVVLGSTGDNNYGYDSAYANIGANSGYIKGGTGASTSFTFTGTGFQLYGNSNSASGYVTVYSQGSLSKLYMINTQLNGTANKVTGNQQTDAAAGATYYSLPFISETDLPHGTYTVQIKQTNNAGAIYLDGVRIINTINDKTEGEENIYYDDEEDKPDFYQLRDYVLNAIGVEDLTSSQYINPSDRSSLDAAVSEMAGQVYNALGDGTKAVIIDNNTTFKDTDAQDLLDNGPKNELYLYQNQTLAFKVTTDRVVQLGLKAPKGSAAFDLKVNGNDVTYKVNGAATTLNSLNTPVDMFYKIAEKGGSEHTVTITNTGSNVLSVTDLKICDDPNATFAPLTAEDIEAVLFDLCDVPEEEKPVVPETPVEPETPTEPSKPTEPTEPEKPTEPEVEETKPSKPGKPGNNKPGNNKPGKPSKPNKPGKDEEKADKVATLKVTYVTMFGRKVGTATLTKEGTGRCIFSAAEIRAAAPAGRMAIWMIPTMINYGTSASIVVPVI